MIHDLYDTDRIEVSTVDQGGEGHTDSVSQLLLVAKPNLTLVVNLGPDCCPVLQHVLGPDAEAGGGAGAAPAQAHPGLQRRAHLLVDRPPKICSVGHTGVQHEVRGRVAQPEVVLGDGGLPEVKAGLVTCQPTLAIGFKII